MILNSKPGGGAEQALNVALLVKTSLKKTTKQEKQWEGLFHKYT